MPHSGTDDRQRNPMISRYRGPRVAGDVGGQRNPGIDQLRQLLEFAVVHAQGVVILPESRSGLGRPDQGKHIRAGWAIPFVPPDDTLDAGLHPDLEALSGLVAAIGDDPVADGVAPQKRDIDECHAAHAVAEHEQVARQSERGVVPEVEPLQRDHRPLVQRPLAGAVDPRIDAAEGKPLLHDVLLHRLIIDRPQDPHVERDGIAHEVAPPQPLGIRAYQPLVQPGERNVAAQKTGEAARRAPVIARRSETAESFEFVAQPQHVVQHLLTAARRSKAPLQIDVRATIPRPTGDPGTRTPQFVTAPAVPPHAGRRYLLPLPRIGHREHLRSNLHPAFFVIDEIIHRPRPPGLPGSSEFYLYCCHIFSFIFGRYDSTSSGEQISYKNSYPPNPAGRHSQRRKDAHGAVRRSPGACEHAEGQVLQTDTAAPCLEEGKNIPTQSKEEIRYKQKKSRYRIETFPDKWTQRLLAITFVRPVNFSEQVLPS